VPDEDRLHLFGLAVVFYSLIKTLKSFVTLVLLQHYKYKQIKNTSTNYLSGKLLPEIHLMQSVNTVASLKHGVAWPKVYRLWWLILHLY